MPAYIKCKMDLTRQTCDTETVLLESCSKMEWCNVAFYRRRLYCIWCFDTWTNNDMAYTFGWPNYRYVQRQKLIHNSSNRKLLINKVSRRQCDDAHTSTIVHTYIVQKLWPYFVPNSSEIACSPCYLNFLIFLTKYLNVQCGPLRPWRGKSCLHFYNFIVYAWTVRYNVTVVHGVRIYIQMWKSTYQQKPLRRQRPVRHIFLQLWREAYFSHHLNWWMRKWTFSFQSGNLNTFILPYHRDDLLHAKQTAELWSTHAHTTHSIESSGKGLTKQRQFQHQQSLRRYENMDAYGALRLEMMIMAKPLSNAPPKGTEWKRMRKSPKIFMKCVCFKFFKSYPSKTLTFGSTRLEQKMLLFRRNETMPKRTIMHFKSGIILNVHCFAATRNQRREIQYSVRTLR